MLGRQAGSKCVPPDGHGRKQSGGCVRAADGDDPAGSLAHAQGHRLAAALGVAGVCVSLFTLGARQALQFGRHLAVQNEVTDTLLARCFMMKWICAISILSRTTIQMHQPHFMQR
jgi:hypothetical protein